MSLSVEKKKISDILDLIKTGFETGDFSAFFSSFALDENNSDVNENCFFSPEKDKYYEGVDSVKAAFKEISENIKSGKTVYSCKKIAISGFAGVRRKTDKTHLYDSLIHTFLFFPADKPALLLSTKKDGKKTELILDFFPSFLDSDEEYSWYGDEEDCDTDAFKIYLRKSTVFNYSLPDDNFLEEKKLSDEQIENAVNRFFDGKPDDEEMFSPLEYYFREKYSRQYSGDLEIFSFVSALRHNNYEYVYENVDNIDINDKGSYSSYLYETTDNEIKDLLFEYGAIRNEDDYCNEKYKFVYDNDADEVLVFNEDFQKKVYNKYKKVHKLNDKLISRILESEGNMDDEDDDDDIDYCTIYDELDTLGISSDDGEIVFGDPNGDPRDILEELGWECDFEGETNHFGSYGVYFIK